MEREDGKVERGERKVGEEKAREKAYPEGGRERKETGEEGARTNHWRGKRTE